MTRTLFVGEPAERDLAVYELVARAQAAAIAPDRGDGRRRAGAAVRARRSTTSPARLIEADGRWPAYGHGLGHGIGLATHELPSLGAHGARRAAAVADGVLGRARDLPRGRDRRPDRGPRPARRRRRPGRAPDAVPARGHRRSGLMRRRVRAGPPESSPVRYNPRPNRPRTPASARPRRAAPPRSPTRHDQHR